MTLTKFPPCIPALCAALMLAACGGESTSAPAVPSALNAPQASHFSSSRSAFTLQAPAQNPRAMQEFTNVGDTSYANSTLKFVIHSFGTTRLVQHLNEFAAASDTLHRAAAQGFIQLIESSYSETAPTQQELEGFFAQLQELPAFSSRHDSTGALLFPIVGDVQDVGEFLMRLSNSFALNALYGDAIALQDDANTVKSEKEFWTVLKPSSADDSLQDVFDRTQPDNWQFTLNRPTPHLTVKIDNTPQGSHDGTPLSNKHFNFNQPVRLQTTSPDGKETQILTLEPREVIEFKDSLTGGHYLTYVKDGQWFQHDDSLVTPLDLMPAIENVRFINFIITQVESAR